MLFMGQRAGDEFQGKSEKGNERKKKIPLVIQVVRIGSGTSWRGKLISHCGGCECDQGCIGEGSRVGGLLDGVGHEMAVCKCPSGERDGIRRVGCGTRNIE